MAMPVVLFYQLVACHTPTRNDTFAGPAGRQADLVGAPYVLHKEDLRRIAPMWLHYTRLVRNDTKVRSVHVACRQSMPAETACKRVCLAWCTIKRARSTGERVRTRSGCCWRTWHRCWGRLSNEHTCR
jgi:hypothetical protein